MTIPYTFASAASPIPLSELDANFATPITLGSTAMILGETYTTISGLTLTSPTFTNPILGTPASGNLSNCSGVIAGCSGYLPTNLGAGLVPVGSLASSGTPSTTTYLRGDRTWGSPPAPSSLATTNFTVQQIGSKLYFQYNGTSVASLDSSGNFITLGSETAGGTP
jgi:hypothetical protein